MASLLRAPVAKMLAPRTSSLVGRVRYIQKNTGPWRTVVPPKVIGHSVPDPTEVLLTNEVFLENDLIPTEHLPGMKTFILNRPKALNAINSEMVKILNRKLRDIENNPSIAHVMLRAHGGKAFCAGGDVKSLALAARNGNYNEGIGFFRREYKLDFLIRTLRKHTYAWMDGITMGGGVGIGCNTDFPIATQNTVFAMPETAIGFFPDVGASRLLCRNELPIALYIGLTGAKLNGADLINFQFASHLIRSQLRPNVQEMLSRSSDYASAEEMSEALACLETLEELPPNITEDIEEDIQKCFTASSVEEIIEKLREHNTPWAQQTVATLNRMSPTSLKVTFEQLSQVKQNDLDFADCLQMDFRLANRFIKGHDFVEGVRALLIDKDNKPQWKPARLEDVSADQVASYFQPLNEEDGAMELQLTLERETDKMVAMEGRPYRGRYVAVDDDEPENVEGKEETKTNDDGLGNGEEEEGQEEGSEHDFSDLESSDSETSDSETSDSETSNSEDDSSEYESSSEEEERIRKRKK